jgi:hypothetical protein
MNYLRGAFVRRIACDSRRRRYLPISSKTRQVAALLVDQRVVPPEKPGDALQMAVCVVHGIDYLLS